MIQRRPMCWALFTACLIALGCTGNQPATPGPASTQAAAKNPLVGTWTVESVQMDGKGDPDLKGIPPLRITESSLWFGNDEKSYKLDPEHPGTIVISREEMDGIADDPVYSVHFGGAPKVTKGTYALDGDTLTLRLKEEMKSQTFTSKGATEIIKEVDVVLKAKKTAGTPADAASPKKNARLQPSNQWQGAVASGQFDKALPQVMRVGFPRKAAGLVLTSRAELEKLWNDVGIKEPLPPIDFDSQCAFILIKFQRATALDSVEVDENKRITHIHFKGEKDRKDDVRYIIAAFPRDQIRAVGSQDPKK